MLSSLEVVAWGWENKRGGEGLVEAYRVWRIKTNNEERLRLQRLYLRVSSAVKEACKVLKERHGEAFGKEPEKFSNELIGEASRIARLPKGLLYYAVEWWKMLAEARGKSRRRSRFTPPPMPLLVKVVDNGERLHGKSDALAVLDASKGALRIPSVKVAVRLKPSLVKAVLEDIQRFSDVKLTLQLTARGRLRLVAHRKVKKVWWNGNSKLAVIALDVNSNHGLYLMTFAFDGEVRLLAQRVFKPPNTTMLKLLAAIMRSYSKVKSWDEAVERFKVRRDVRGLRREGRGYAVGEALKLAERLRAKINLTPERAERIARQASRKVRKLNEDWVRGARREVRELVRKLRNQGYTVVIVADMPRAESLRGTKLQRTLLRTAKRLENLAAYEGARWFQPDNNISGKQCPICGKEGVEVQRRYYRCPKCGPGLREGLGRSLQRRKALPEGLQSRKATRGAGPVAPEPQDSPNAGRPRPQFPRLPEQGRSGGAARGARRGCARGNAG
ncbi:transposase [Infirmifilum sp. NZ]|uniref:transposase n=1 Tax=Infirmifilum sp. NZ TaxID=2926850 RepID=UPI00279EAB7C|nr:transposase [Infirmifilum sp. NZ]UNQ73820.1 transposase [Infirmifilum sp. NZ]